MASLNDIDSQLDTVISALSSGGVNNTVIYEASVTGGTYTLVNDKTFADIRADISAGKMPIINILRDPDTNFFYMPTILSLNPQGEGDKILTWYCMVPIVAEDKIVLSVIYENTTNTFNSISKTIT